jgi:hypothetical protein
MTSIARHEQKSPSDPQLPVEPKPERSVLQKLGIAFQPPAQAEYGADAYPSILRRATSVFSLGAISVFLGVAVAFLMGSFILVIGFLLEQAISS